MSKYINAELIKALMKNDRLMQGNAESVMWQQEVERRVDRLPSIDTEFIDFLFNVINPNEMEEYISMFKARAEQTEPQTCEECEHWNDPDDGCADRHGCKTEPQTEVDWKDEMWTEAVQTDCTTCDQVGRCERGRAVDCPLTERSE